MTFLTHGQILDKLDELHDEHGVGYKEVADAIGVHRVHYSKVRSKSDELTAIPTIVRAFAYFGYRVRGPFYRIQKEGDVYGPDRN